MTFAFPKKQHLSKRDAISALASGGEVLFKYPIKAFFLKTDSVGYQRYVFTVPKKLFKRAVKRNLLKRRMREAVRLNQEAVLGGFCADFLLVYIGKDICPYAVIEAAVKEILAKGKQMAEEPGIPAKVTAKDIPAGGKQMTEGKGKPAKTESRS